MMSHPTYSSSSEQKEWTVVRPTTREIRYATWIAFFAWVFAVYDFILFGTLLPEIGKHFGWNAAQQAGIATSVALGGVLVTFAIGPLMDKVGRRKGIVLTVAGAAVCSLLTAVAGDWGKGALVFIRSVAGLGYAEQTVNATYLTELYSSTNDPKLARRKGLVYSLVQGGWPVGALLAAGLTALLLPLIGWKNSFIFAAVPSFIIALLALRLKESPQFQIHQRAAWLSRNSTASEASSFASQYGVDVTAHHSNGFTFLKERATLRTTLILGGAHLLNWFAIQVFSVLGSTVIVSVHNVSFENSLLILILSNIVGYLGYLSHGWLGDKIGRRNTIGFGWILGSISFAAMLLAPSNFYTIVVLYSLGLFFLIGPYAAMLFFISESYPTSIRGTASAIVGGLGPVGAIIAGIGATWMLSSGGDWFHAALWCGALPCFASGVLIFLADKIQQ